MHALDTLNTESGPIGLKVSWIKTKIQKVIAFFDENKDLPTALVSYLVCYDLVIGTRLWEPEHIHRQLFLIYIRWFGDLWSRFYCDLVFKFLRGSLLFAGIPSVGEQDTVHTVAELEYLAVLVGFKVEG